MEKRYQVFISSTFTDLREERRAIIDGLLNADFIPAMMEAFTASNDEQFEYIKRRIDLSDYYILIIGARYGSINKNTGKSFTEQEYEYAVEKGIPILVFLHSDPYNLPASKREDDKRNQLENFREKVSQKRLCKMWNTIADLVYSVINSLNQEVIKNPQKGWIRYEDFEDRVNLTVQSHENFILKVSGEEIELTPEESKALGIEWSDDYT